MSGDRNSSDDDQSSLPGENLSEAGSLQDDLRQKKQVSTKSLRFSIVTRTKSNPIKEDSYKQETGGVKILSSKHCLILEIIEIEEEGRDSPLFSRSRLESLVLQEDSRIGLSNAKQSRFAHTIQPDQNDHATIQGKRLDFSKGGMESQHSSDKTDQLSIKSKSMQSYKPASEVDVKN